MADLLDEDGAGEGGLLRVVALELFVVSMRWVCDGTEFKLLPQLRASRSGSRTQWREGGGCND
jgi:hypothetical protein